MTEVVAAFLIFMSCYGGPCRTETYPMQDMETCLKALEKTKIESTYESGFTVAIFCTNGEAE